MLQTRILYGLAAEGKAPRIFLRCNRLGVPYFSLTVASLFCALAYLNVSAGGATTFGYLTATVTVSSKMVK
jgi:amino acid transporter